MRPRLVTLLVALTTVTAVIAIGWGVQAVALPPPGRAELVAAHAAAWLFRYRLVESTFTIGTGLAVHATCTETWFRLPGGQSDRGEVLRMSNGFGIVTLQPRDLDVIGGHRGEARWLPRAQLELAGCPRLLADQIVRAVKSAHKPRLTNSSESGRPVLTLHLRSTPLRLVVLLRPKTDRPVGLRVAGGGYVGHSVLHLARVTPALLSTRGLNR